MTATQPSITAQPTAELAARPSFYPSSFAAYGPCRASHSTTEIEGYVVRQTLGAVGQSHPQRPGRDVLHVTHSGHYAVAVERALALQDYPHSWAVIDCLYECGCRS